MAKTLEKLAWIDSSGFHVADFEDFLEYHTDAFKAIYGNDVNLDADSQDGEWLTHIAQTEYDLAQLCAATFANFSPSTACDEPLSREVKINGIARKAATNSTCDVKISGKAGTGISSGTVQDTAGNTWLLPDVVTIPTGGEITVTATAKESGKITAGIGTLTKIGTPTDGWEAVTNETEAAPGSDAETDAALRVRQTYSVALPSQAVLTGIQGAIANVSGVTQCKVYENDTSETDADGIPGHSICAVVYGGDSEAVAKAIFLKKTAGAGTYGTTEVKLTDSEGVGHTIKFYRPTIVHVAISVTIEPLSGYVSTYADEIKAEIFDYVNSLGIGATVRISKLYSPGNLEAADHDPHDSTYDIESIEISGDGGTIYQSTNLKTAFNELPIIDSVDDIEVVVDD